MESNNNQKNIGNTVDQGAPEKYEEISEKKTSMLGYILLVIMVFFIVGIGQTIFSDLEKIPDRPNPPSYCISPLGDSAYLEDLSYEPNCIFHEIDQKFGLENQYNNILPDINQIISYNRQILVNESGIRTKENELNKLNRDYDLSLQEKMANEQAILDKSNIKYNITSKNNELNNLNIQNSTLKSQRDAVIKKINPKIAKIVKTYNEAQEYYKDKNGFYKFKVFSLMLLFVLPFFVFSTFFYLRLKRKNSPYTIIFTAIATASSLLFIQIVLMFLYEVLPMEWFGRIFRFLMEVSILRYIIYYGSVILVIAVFGGLVYFIQKRVFSPAKVAVRRIKDNKCPGCSFRINPEHNFCPQCGFQLKEKCAQCNNLKIRYLAHCPYCGR